MACVAEAPQLPKRLPQLLQRDVKRRNAQATLGRVVLAFSVPCSDAVERYAHLLSPHTLLLDYCVSAYHLRYASMKLIPEARPHCSFDCGSHSSYRGCVSRNRSGTANQSRAVVCIPTHPQCGQHGIPGACLLNFDQSSVQYPHVMAAEYQIPRSRESADTDAPSLRRRKSPRLGSNLFMAYLSR